MDIESIWFEFRSGLKAFLHSRVSNPDDADDLLQEILIKVHNNLNTLNSDKSIKSWIYQIANNVITDFYRKKTKLHNFQAEELWYDKDCKNALHDLEPCIRPFIDALPVEYSELITAIDLQGQSQKEYAEQNHIKYSTLKSRVQKSRDLLRGLFEECCHFSIDKFGNIMDCDDKKNNCSQC